ncbi:MAG: hypothetical protein V4537_12270 [Pseudomonadota bacterium]
MTETTIGEPARRDRIAALLRRYPDLPSDDTHELLTFLKTGAILDIGMLKGNPDTRDRIARVHADHAAWFRPTILQRLFVAALLVVPVLLMCWMAWYWGTK